MLHKSDVGAVALSLDGEQAVREAASELAARIERAGHHLDGFLAQAMAGRGVEMLVGVVQDPSFGSVVACGAGGTTVELLKDVSVRLSPLDEGDADEMIRSLVSFPLLQGYRRQPAADLNSLKEVLLRVSALVEAHEEVAELDLNPVVVGRTGATVMDARIRVERHPPRPPEGSRPRTWRE